MRRDVLNCTEPTFIHRRIIIRLDHIAYRVADRKKTARFFIDAFGYLVQQEFQIDFGNNEFAECISLEPPEKCVTSNLPWTHLGCHHIYDISGNLHTHNQEYHAAPEIFVSDGTPGSVVGEWVAARNGVGGIHHLAYMVDNVAAKMGEWKAKGYAEFTSDDVMQCPGLTQVFTKPSALTGVIYEFINRTEFGFCKENVKQLMLSTDELR